MGLYNMLFGTNSDAPHVLRLLGWTRDQVPRFRDAYLTNRDGNTVIAVYTRMGGGNRGCWEDRKPGCPCVGCAADNVLAKHHLYISDKDDDFDHTYATYYYRLPEEVDVRELDVEGLSGDEKWNNFFEQLEKVRKERQ